MAEFRERPFRCAMALRAVVSEQAAVPVLGLVAGRAIEQRLLALELRRVRRGVAFGNPGDKRVARLIVRDGSVLDLL